MNQKNFRRLILLYVALIVADIAVVGLAPAGYSQALSDALDNEPPPALFDNLWLMLAVTLPLAVAAIAGIFGLYLFKAWGGFLSLVSTIGGLIVFTLFGPSLYGPIEAMVWEASTLVWGAVVALAYFSPVAVHFERAKPWPDSIVEN